MTVNVWSISYSMSYTTADLDRRLKRVPEKDRAAVRSYVMTKAAPAREIRAWCHRGPQSLSAHAARHATRIGDGLRAVRDEAELSEHQESVPIPAKVLDLAISRDAHERGGNS